MKNISIIKADGTTEAFKEAKLVRSLRKAGASRDEVSVVVEEVKHELYDGITTEEIYRRAFSILRSLPTPVAARYSLRRALFGLGPTGFPFEDYLAALFRHDGYTTRTRVSLRGQCALHETDVIAKKGREILMIEAKFHLQPGIKTDLQVALYTHARYLDIQSRKDVNFRKEMPTRGGIITNTKFSQSALQYGLCNNLFMMSWDFPKEQSLATWIERTKLYPITVLSSLTSRDKDSLIREGAVLCSDIVDNPALLSAIGVPDTKISRTLAEGAHLCRIKE